MNSSHTAWVLIRAALIAVPSSAIRYGSPSTAGLLVAIMDRRRRVASLAISGVTARSASTTNEPRTHQPTSLPPPPPPVGPAAPVGSGAGLVLPEPLPPGPVLGTGPLWPGDGVGVALGSGAHGL